MFEQVGKHIAKVLGQFAGPMARQILHHLARRLPDPNTTVIVAGFQAKGTRGRKLLEKALLKYARKHGYIRGAEPTKMRTRPKVQPA